MAYGHKLKLTNTKKLAICQNLLPPKFPAVRYCILPDVFIVSLLLVY